MKPFKLEEWARPNVLQMKAYSSARDEFGEQRDDLIYLDANENPYPSSVNRYPDPSQNALKKRLSALRKVPTDQILIGNGSDEVLDLIFRAFAEPSKDRLLTFPPTYGMYSVLAELNAIEVLEAPLDPETFDLNFDRIAAQMQLNPKLICLPNPNNPSGNGWPLATVKKLLDMATGIVIIDEAYIDFAPFESAITLLDEYPHLIVSQTFSKAFGLAGARLGIAYASPEIIVLLNRIKPPYNINSLSQSTAEGCLSNSEKRTKEIKTILEEKVRISLYIKNMNFVKKIFPSDANFLLIRVDDADKRYQQFLKAGVVLRNRSTQLHCQNTLRISIGTPQENLKFMELCRQFDQNEVL